MILIIKICKNNLHDLEFVKPIEDILRLNNISFMTYHYKDISNRIISRSKKIIISGTSLKDNSFLDDIKHFQWLEEFNIPVLGICGGMHILGLVHDGKLKKQQEIGLIKIKFYKYIFGMFGPTDVYELHNFYVDSKDFTIEVKLNNVPQLIKHKNKPFYGILFHPEVRNKDFILKFVKNS
jgi:GMP synthase (glutamine-hydrolysing)